MAVKPFLQHKVSPCRASVQFFDSKGSAASPVCRSPALGSAACRAVPASVPAPQRSARPWPQHALASSLAPAATAPSPSRTPHQRLSPPKKCALASCGPLHRSNALLCPGLCLLTSPHPSALSCPQHPLQEHRLPVPRSPRIANAPALTSTLHQPLSELLPCTDQAQSPSTRSPRAASIQVTLSTALVCDSHPHPPRFTALCQTPAVPGITTHRATPCPSVPHVTATPANTP